MLVGRSSGTGWLYEVSVAGMMAGFTRGTLWLPLTRCHLSNLRRCRSDIIISGIGIRDAAPTYMQRWGVPSGGDWSLYHGAAVDIHGAKDVHIVGCRFDRLDNNAILLSGYTRDVNISDNEAVWLGMNFVCLCIFVCSDLLFEGGIEPRATCYFEWDIRAVYTRARLLPTLTVAYGRSTHATPLGVLLRLTIRSNCNGPPPQAAAWGDTDGHDGTKGNQPRFTTLARNFVHEIGIYEKQSSMWFQVSSFLSSSFGFRGRKKRRRRRF